MRTIAIAAALLVAVFAVPASARDDKAAKPDKPEAKKPVYDEKADAEVAVKTALAAAKRENRRVVIQWGGNWCVWCVLLRDRFQSDRDLAKKLRYEYDVVYVDV